MAGDRVRRLVSSLAPSASAALSAEPAAAAGRTARSILAEVARAQPPPREGDPPAASYGELWDGLAPCLEQALGTKHTCKELANALVHWAAVEREYIKGLPFTRKRHEVHACEQGTLGRTLEVFCGSFAKIAEARGRVSSLVAAMGTQLHHFRREQNATKRKLELEGTKLRKGMAAQEAHLQRAKQRYIKACKDAELCIALKEKAHQEKALHEISKLWQRTTDALIAVHESEQQYRSAVEETRIYHITFSQAMQQILQEFQILEESRIEYLKALVHGVLDSLTELANQFDHVLEEVQEKVNDTDSRRDIREFVARHRRPTPEPAAFEKYANPKIDAEIEILVGGGLFSASAHSPSPTSNEVDAAPTLPGASQPYHQQLESGSPQLNVPTQGSLPAALATTSEDKFRSGSSSPRSSSSLPSPHSGSSSFKMPSFSASLQAGMRRTSSSNGVRDMPGPMVGSRAGPCAIGGASRSHRPCCPTRPLQTASSARNVACSTSMRCQHDGYPVATARPHPPVVGSAHQTPPRQSECAQSDAWPQVPSTQPQMQHQQSCQGNGQCDHQDLQRRPTPRQQAFRQVDTGSYSQHEHLHKPHAPQKQEQLLQKPQSFRQVSQSPRVYRTQQARDGSSSLQGKAQSSADLSGRTTSTLLDSKHPSCAARARQQLVGKQPHQPAEQRAQYQTPSAHEEPILQHCSAVEEARESTVEEAREMDKKEQEQQHIPFQQQQHQQKQKTDDQGQMQQLAEASGDSISPMRCGGQTLIISASPLLQPDQKQDSNDGAQHTCEAQTTCKEPQEGQAQDEKLCQDGEISQTCQSWVVNDRTTPDQNEESLQRSQQVLMEANSPLVHHRAPGETQKEEPACAIVGDGSHSSSWKPGQEQGQGLACSSEDCAGSLSLATGNSIDAETPESVLSRDTDESESQSQGSWASQRSELCSSFGADRDASSVYVQRNSSEADFVKVMFAYDQVDSSELTLRVGEVIKVLEKDVSGWWEGLAQDGRVGSFPENYTEAVPTTEAQQLGFPSDGSMARTTGLKGVDSYAQGTACALKLAAAEALSQGCVVARTLSGENPPCRKVVALFDYNAQDPCDLTIKKQEVLSVQGMDEDGGWLEVTDAAGNRGMVPANYVCDMSLSQSAMSA